MQFRRSDFADLSYFLEIAKHRNFRRAGLELGMSASALSHALRGLEERLGVRLLNRTSRSVTLTAAGEALRAAIMAPFEEIGRAVDVVNRFRDAPMGRMRLSVPTEAADLVVGPVLPTFLERYPDVEIEISVSNRMIDVIEGGFDARYPLWRHGAGGHDRAATVAPISAGSSSPHPPILSVSGRRSIPNDLRNHRGIRIRIGDESIYRWEFERGEEEIAIDVPGVIAHRSRPGCMAHGEARRGPDVCPGFRGGADGQGRASCTTVLDEWAAPGPGFHIYYSSRRHVPAGAAALRGAGAGAEASGLTATAQSMNSSHRHMRCCLAALRSL